MKPLHLLATPDLHFEHGLAAGFSAPLVAYRASVRRELIIRAERALTGPGGDPDDEDCDREASR